MSQKVYFIEQFQMHYDTKGNLPYFHKWRTIDNVQDARRLIEESRLGLSRTIALFKVTLKPMNETPATH